MNAGKLVFAFAHPFLLLLQLLGALPSRAGLRVLKFRLGDFFSAPRPVRAASELTMALLNSANWHCVLGIRIIGA